MSTELREQRDITGNPENPSVPLTFDNLSSGGWETIANSTLAGIRLDKKKILGLPAIWRAISIVSSDVAKLPLAAYRKDATNPKNKTLDRLHPATKLLSKKPNRLNTPFTFKQTLLQTTLIYGNGFAFIDRLPDATPVELFLLRPGSVTPLIYDGELWYLYRDPYGTLNKLPGHDVIHVRGLGDAIGGYPVSNWMADSISGMIAARDFATRFYDNDARPGAYIKHPGKLSDPARSNMRNSWERLHKGVKNSHKVAILEEGAEVGEIGTGSARDAQLLEARKFSAVEVANIYGVPAHKLGDSSKVAYNSLDAENQSYYDDTLSSWLVVTAEQCTEKLLTEAEKENDSHECAFDYNELSKADITQQTNFVTAMTNGKLISKDEGRFVFGYPPLPDGMGDFANSFKEPVQPAVGGQLPAAGDPKQDPQTDPNDPNADPDGDPAEDRSITLPGITPGLRAVAIDTAKRMCKRLATHARKAKDIDQWAGTVAGEHSAVIRDSFGSVLLAYRDAGAKPVTLERLVPEIVGFAVRLVKQFGSEGGADKLETQGAEAIVSALTKGE